MNVMTAAGKIHDKVEGENPAKGSSPKAIGTPSQFEGLTWRK